MSTSFLISLLFTVLLNVSLCSSYNILVIFGHPGKSHYDAFSAMFEVLAKRGHNITILSHVHIKNTKNIRHVPLRDEEPMLHVMDLAYISQNRLLYSYRQNQLLRSFADENCLKDLQNEKFQNFLKEDHQFDLIMGEMFNTNCYDGLVTKFKAPFIGLSSCSLMPWQFEWFGIPSNPSYIQNIFGGSKAPMSFISRLENTILQVYSNTWYKLTMEKLGKEYSKKYTGFDAADPRNASLILVNTHYTVEGAKPLTPNVIEVGGIHIHNKKPKPLPKDIETWIDNSAEGVIYFNLGSMIKGATFPEEQRRAFAKAFAKLPQRVLWKYENDTMPDLPDNVMIGKWMPQFDILSHPNVKLFISHGGLLGTNEAVHCGVPLIIMPQFGDQRHNAHAVENKGAGVILHLQSATEELVSAALKKALDPQIYKNAKALSERFRDRPLSPMDTAVYWVEHVAKFKGAQHMKSPAIDMPFYEYFLIDVIIFLVLVNLVFSYILYKTVRLFLGKYVLSNGNKLKSS